MVLEMSTVYRVDTLQDFLIKLDMAPSDLQTPLPYQNFSPLANVVYLIAIINKTPLRNGNCPIMNLITKMGVAHTVEHETLYSSSGNKHFFFTN